MNAELQARAGVYVAGDAASYWDPVLGFRRRVEHLNFAEETGTLAGKNMASNIVIPQKAGEDKQSSSQPPANRYRYQSSFWSTLGGNYTWDAIGLVDSKRLITRSFFSPFKSTDSQETTTTTTDEASAAERPIFSIPDTALGRLGRGVVFYLTPKDKQLVGILLWNLPEEIYFDKDFAAPSRLNVARSMLLERRRIGAKADETDELMELVRHFDLFGELQEDYSKLKAYADTKAKELLAESEGGEAGDMKTESKEPSDEKR